MIPLEQISISRTLKGVSSPGQNIPHHLEGLLHNGHRQVCPIIYQSSNILLGHLGKLLLKDTFKTGKDDQTFSGVVVVHDSKFDIAIPFFYDSWLQVSMLADMELSSKTTTEVTSVILSPGRLAL